MEKMFSSDPSRLVSNRFHHIIPIYESIGRLVWNIKFVRDSANLSCMFAFGFSSLTGTQVTV